MVAVTAVVGSDATMVYDALHNVVATALGDLDPSFALQDFTVKDVTTGADSVISALLEALNTPPFLVSRRVVVLRDAQALLADEVATLLAWMAAPAPDIVLLLAVVGAKSNKLVKAAQDVIDVHVATGAKNRVAFVNDKMAEYRVSLDAAAVARVSERVGDDVARVDSLARLLSSIYGSAPLNVTHIEPYLGDAGTLPEWDLTDALESGNASRAITVARRMLDSRARGRADHLRAPALLPAHGAPRGRRGDESRGRRAVARHERLRREETPRDVLAHGGRTHHRRGAPHRPGRRRPQGRRQLRR